MTPDEATAALLALGSTADEVAETLLRGGHRGRLDDTCYCPVAVYLRALGADDPYVDLEWTTVGWDSDPVHVPDQIADFIETFDSGAFPQLVLP